MRHPRPRRPILSIAATSCALAMLAPAIAVAQSAEAEALFAEAERLEAADDLDAACDAFEASNRIEPRAGTMIRLADCRRAQGRLASAWSAYKDALTRAKDPRKVQLAEAGVADLEPRLSFLTILVSDESRVDGLAITRDGAAVDPALWNRAIPVDGGSYTIAGRAPGYREWSVPAIVANEGEQVVIEVPRFSPIPIMPAPPPAPVVERIEPAPTGMTGRRKVAIGLGVTGVAALATGGVLLGQALSLEAEAMDLQSNELNRDAVSRARFAYVGFGVGAAAVVGATIFWLTGRPDGVVRF